MRTTIRVMMMVMLLAASAARAGMVRHFVAFRFKPEVSAPDRAEVRRRFLELRRAVHAPGDAPYLVSIESGDADSPEGLDQHMTQAYLVTFRTPADRDYYVNQDPAHQAFKAFVGPLLDGVYVFDYRTEER